MAAASKRSVTLTALIIAVALIAIDFSIKNVVIENIAPFSIRPFIPGILDFTYVTNDSAAFSIGFGITGIFTAISSLAALGLIWYLRKIETIGWAIMAGIALAGICGNLIDRFIRAPFGGVGHVVDYIKIPFNFPIFNLADSLIVSMAILTVIRVMLGHQIGKAGKLAKDAE